MLMDVIITAASRVFSTGKGMTTGFTSTGITSIE
jgi:hypothetical protein